GPASGPLQRLVRLEPREAAFGARRIVPVDERLAGYDEQGDASGPQRYPRVAGIEHAGRERRRAIERAGDGAVTRCAQHADLELAGPAVAERDPERERQHQRKAEHPEDRLRLAVKL